MFFFAVSCYFKSICDELYYCVLLYVMLQYIVQYCAVLYFIDICYFTSFYDVLHYISLLYVMLFCFV